MNLVAPRAILIVEDESLIAFDLQSKLLDAGYSVSGIADSMTEALEAAERFLPGLVLMDLQIKGEHDGVETASRLRQKWGVPVIFVTSHADVRTIERIRGAGAAGIISKPFLRVDFRAQIEAMLCRTGDASAWSN